MFQKLLPHVCIVLAVSMLVFLIIDQVNSAMAFVDNQATKLILMLLMVLVVILALMFLVKQRQK